MLLQVVGKLLLWGGQGPKLKAVGLRSRRFALFSILTRLPSLPPQGKAGRLCRLRFWLSLLLCWSAWVIVFYPGKNESMWEEHQTFDLQRCRPRKQRNILFFRFYTVTKGSGTDGLCLPKSASVTWGMFTLDPKSHLPALMYQTWYLGSNVTMGMSHVGTSAPKRSRSQKWPLWHISRPVSALHGQVCGGVCRYECCVCAHDGPVSGMCVLVTVLPGNSLDVTQT